ncbi:hypothetical protein [Porticoccus sp.]|uniref:hypothetical protein n=1 Tax=Porticoccus sp. TaxID=2024853 RepID=UPI003F69C3B0
MKRKWIQILESYLTFADHPVSAKFPFVLIFSIHNIALPSNFMGAVGKRLLSMTR